MHRTHRPTAPTRLRARARAGLLIGALGLVALACQSQVFVDGLPIGDRVDGDARFSDFAVLTLDQVAPGHAPVASVEMYTPNYRTPEGATILTNRSGGHDLIVVLRLSDGSARAFYVGCGVGLDTERCFLGPPDSPGFDSP